MMHQHRHTSAYALRICLYLIRTSSQHLTDDKRLRQTLCLMSCVSILHVYCVHDVHLCVSMCPRVFAVLACKRRIVIQYGACMTGGDSNTEIRDPLNKDICVRAEGYYESAVICASGQNHLSPVQDQIHDLFHNG